MVDLISVLEGSIPSSGLYPKGFPKERSVDMIDMILLQTMINDYVDFVIFIPWVKIA